MGLTIDEVGPLFLEAIDLYRRLHDAGMFDDGNEGALLPDDMLTCDEACRMVGAVYLLAIQLFPALEVPDDLERAMRDAALRVTSPNVRH